MSIRSSWSKLRPKEIPLQRRVLGTRTAPHETQDLERDDDHSPGPTIRTWPTPLRVSLMMPSSARLVCKKTEPDRDRTRKHLAGFIVSGLLAVIGVACSGSGATSPSSTTSTTTVAPVTLSPTSLAFANNAAAGSSQTVTLTNTGSDTLTITSIAVSGNFLEADDCGTSVGLGATCTITVTFNPVAVGGSGGALTITDDASNSPQTVTLTGPNILGPNGILVPSSLTFGSQPVGTMSPAQTVTLTNPVNGVSAPLSIFGQVITGDFAVAQNDCGSSLAAGASCTVSITFTPSVPGPHFGYFATFDNAPLGLQSTSLSGSGQ